MISSRETTCPIEVGACNRWFGDRQLKRVNRVHVIFGSGEVFNRISSSYRKLTDNKVFNVPVLCIANAQGEVLGFVESKDNSAATQQIKSLIAIAAWQQDASKQIEKADQQAADGAFRSALATIKKIQQQDVKATASLAQVNGQKPDTASEQGQFFGDLTAQKRDAYEQLGQQRLQQARDLMNQGDTSEAMRTISPMLSSKNELPCCEQAVTLKAEIFEKMRNSEASRATN